MFIVGAPRSGTSILYRTVLKHPAFAVVGDEALQLAESGLLDSLHAAPRWKTPRPPRLFLFFLRDEAAYGRFLDDVRAVTAGADPVEAGTRPPWTDAVIDAFVEHATAARSCRRLVEKTPTHIDRAEWLLDARPDATLLFVHRHPLDTYTSYLRRAEVDEGARPWAALTPAQFAEIYRRHTTIARRLATAHPERFRPVSYEAFTTEPAGVVAGLCDLLGEPFQPDMVEEPAPDLTRARNDPHLFGAITTDTKTWQDHVDVATAAEVEDLTADAAAAWGYHRRTG